MAPASPLTRIVLGAGSVADDLGYVALTDVAQNLGVPPIVAQDHNIVSRLKDLNYLQIAGNRFARGLTDIPVGMKGGGGSSNPEALIDVLVPTYTGRARENVQVGEDLFTTEVPGLYLALARPPVNITLELHRLNAPMTALTSGELLSTEAADVRFTRIKALIARVLGSG